MGNSFWFVWEPQVIIFLQSHITPFLQKLFEIITFLGDEYAMVILLGFLYWGYHKELGKKIAIGVITALVTSVALNNLVMRRRPYLDHPDIKCLKARTSDADPNDLFAQGFSFPSGHATGSLATYGALGFNVKSKWVKGILYVLVFLIGLSRLVLGVHYPTDILAGWVFSTLILMVISRIKNQHVTYFLLALIGLVGCFFCKSRDYYSALGIAFGFIGGFIFEEKIVHFQNTQNGFRMILRTVGGLVLFAAVSTLLKLPFSDSFLTSGSALSFVVRTVRYMLASFVVSGVYPLLFSRVDRLIDKKRIIDPFKNPGSHERKSRS